MTRNTDFSAMKRRWTAAPWCLVAAWAQAQTPAPAVAPAAEAPSARATSGLDSGVGAPVTPSTNLNLKMPELRDLSVAVPRPVRAATAMLGMGRQRLALVVGISTIGARQVVDNAGRDAQAVATALREGGFVVMLREDLGSADLRATLQEFHDRLQPGGVGFAYVTGLGAQLEGQNWLLPRDSNLDPALPLAERQAQWRRTGVPLADVVDALMGPSDSPRMLVVDAAYQNPALNGLPVAGLAAQKLPPGMMALFGHPLGKTQDVPAVGALPNPPPTDARELAASPFARALVAQLLAPRKRAPEVLRATHRSLYDGSLGQNELWIAGDTDNEELAEASLLDVIPRTPEEIAREVASQAGRALTRHTASAAASTASATASAGTISTATTAGAAAAGEQSVTEVLGRAPKAKPSLNVDPPPGENMRPSSARNALADTPNAPSTPPSAPSAPSAPNLPNVPRPPTSLLSQAASAGNAVSTAAGAVGTAASVAGTAAGVAASVATVAAVAKATEAAAAVSVATTALSAAGSVAGQVMALASRSVTGSVGEPQAAAVQQIVASRAAQTASTKAASNTAAAAVAEAAAPAAATSVAAAAAPAATATAVAAQAAQAIQGAQPVSALRASAAVGDLPVEQFSPAALATAAPTSAATAAKALGSKADGLAGGGEASATTATSATTAATETSPGGRAGAMNTTASNKANPARTANATQTAKPELQTPDNRTVRNAAGGERPAYTPRTNSYGYAEGDTYTYLVMDTWKGEVTQRYTTAIEEVLPDGQMMANGQQMLMDAQGRLKKLANADGSVSKFEPSQDLWWSSPKRGETRDLHFTETVERTGSRASEIEWKGSTSVGKAQKIDTPAGEFEVLPIESKGWAYEMMADGLRSTKWSRTVWYSPKLGHPVAIDIEDADRLGKLLKRERVELLHAQASRAATP